MVGIVWDWFGMLGFVLPSFDTPDPLAEQYPHLSPYAHCAANPITLTDPTGMYFNSADSTQAAIYMERLNQRIIQINKSDAKDRHEQLSEVNKSLQDIEDMRNDCWVELFQMPMEIRVKTIKEINVSYLKRLYQNKKFLNGGFSDDWYKK